MALKHAAKRTEHAGAKNMGHDKPAPRGDLKAAAKKLRRAADRAFERAARRYAVDRHPALRGRPP